MNVSQQLNHINDNNYDDDIKITDIPKGYFVAVTGNTFNEGSTTRELSVEIMPLEQCPGGTMEINSGLYVRQAGETSVKVTVSQDGSEKATGLEDYK